MPSSLYTPLLPLNLLTVLYYKRDRFRLLGGGLLGGGWALDNFSHILCQYLDSGTGQCHMTDIGTVFPLICPLKMQQATIQKEQSKL